LDAITEEQQAELALGNNRMRRCSSN